MNTNYFKFRIGEAGRHKVLGVLRLLLLRDQGGNVWQQIGRSYFCKNLLFEMIIIFPLRPVDGPRRRAQEEPRRMVDVPEGGR